MFSVYKELVFLHFWCVLCSITNSLSERASQDDPRKIGVGIGQMLSVRFVTFGNFYCLDLVLMD